MSDPFQVAAAVGGCLDVGLRLYTALGTLVTEAGNADSTATELRNKIEELKELLESIQETYDRKQSRMTVALDPDEARIWKTIKASLERCETTLISFDEEVTRLVRRSGPAWSQRVKFALNIQRFDPTMSRLERGIQIYLMALHIKFWSLQVYANNTVVDRLEQIISEGNEYLNTEAETPLQPLQRRLTFPMLEAHSMEQPQLNDTLGYEKEKGMEILEAVRLGEDVVHRSQKGKKALLRTDFGVNVEHAEDVSIEASAEAAKRGDFAAVLQSVTERVGANSRTSDGTTLLMYAARHDHLPAVEALLKAGADVAIKDRHGWSALHYAVVDARNGSLIEQLVQAGLDVNDASKSSGETAFLMASKTYPASKAVMKALLKCHANANQADSQGNTPLSIAVEYNDFLRVRFLVDECGAVYPSEKTPPRGTKRDIMTKLKSPTKRRASAYQ